jgi:serine/threonine protein kinase
MKSAQVHSIWMQTLGGKDIEAANPALSYRPPIDRTMPFREVLQLVDGLAETPKEDKDSGDTSYHLLEQIGAGGMGVVHRARQKRLGRLIAIKTLAPGADELAIENFVAEAMVTAHLDHPNIVPVHDLEEGPSGQWFLAMKLVGGLSWKDLLHPRTAEHKEKAQVMDLQDHFQILIDVCNAVAFAHNKGIVHLDLKPENVMVGEFGEVLLMDWGIAIDIRPRNTKQALEPLPIPHRSEVQHPQGTPCYMAPELASGKGRRIGPWTDVFLLGAMLYEILCGTPPHKGTALLQVLMSAIECPDLEFKGPLVASELKAICRKATAKDPRQRFQTVRGFQQSLQDYLKHRESSKISFEAGQRLEECQHSVKTLFLGGKSKLSATARNHIYSEYADVVAGYRQALLLWDGNKVAIRGEEDARLCFARTALDHGDLGLAQAQSSMLKADWPEARFLLKSISDEVSKRTRTKVFFWFLGIGLAALAILSFFGLIFGLVKVNKARYEAEKKEQEASAATEMAVQRQKEASKARQDAEKNWQLAQQQRSRAQKALQEADIARQAAVKANEKEREQRILVEKRQRLAQSRAEIAKESLDSLIQKITEGSRSKGVGASALTNEVQIRLLETALKGLEKLRQTDVESAAVSPAAMKAHAQMGEAYYYLGKYKNSCKALEQAISVGKKLLKPGSSEETGIPIEIATSLRSLGRAHNALGDKTAMKKAYEEAGELLSKVTASGEGLKQIRINQGRVYLELAILLYQTQRTAESKITFQKSIAFLQPIVAVNPNNLAANFNLALAYLYSGNVCSQQGEFKSAISLLKQSERLWQALVRKAASTPYYRYYWAVSLHDLAVAGRAEGSQRIFAITRLERAVQQLNYMVNVLKQSNYRNVWLQYQQKLAQWKQGR